MLKLDEMYDVWWKLTGIWLEYDVELDEMSWDVWCFESVGTTLSFVKIRWNELRCMMFLLKLDEMSWDVWCMMWASINMDFMGVWQFKIGRTFVLYCSLTAQLYCCRAVGLLIELRFELKSLTFDFSFEGGSGEVP